MGYVLTAYFFTRETLQIVYVACAVEEMVCPTDDDDL